MPRIRREWGTSLLLILILTPFILASIVAADIVTTIENTTVIIADGTFIDEGLFYFITLISIVFFVVALFARRYKDLFWGVSTIFLFVSSILSTRIAKFNTYVVLSPRVVNASNMSVLQESNTLVQAVTYVQPQPLLQVALYTLVGISFVMLIYWIYELYIKQEEQEGGTT